MNLIVGDVGWSIYNSSNNFCLKSLKYFDVGVGCCSPELYSVGPNWFQIVLYISILFSNESLELGRKSQYKFLGLIPKAFLLVKICVFQVGRLSRWIPRYFASSDCGIACEFNIIEGQASCFNVKFNRFRFISLYSPVVKPLR